LIKSQILNQSADAQHPNGVTIEIGNANLSSVGDIIAVARTNADIAVNAESKTYGLAGAAPSYSQAVGASGEAILLGGGANLDSKGNISLLAGISEQNFLDSLEVSALTDLWNKTAFPVDTDPGADAVLQQTTLVKIDAGATLDSVGNANLSA